ncbi:MAG: hypothetical protein RR242_05735 [Clostridium sp.]
MPITDYDTIDISVSPPPEEPFRQQYYIARCRRWVQETGSRLGRPLTCFISTFGCQMNLEYMI